MLLEAKTQSRIIFQIFSGSLLFIGYLRSYTNAFGFVVMVGVYMIGMQEFEHHSFIHLVMMQSFHHGHPYLQVNSLDSALYNLYFHII